MAGYLPIDQNDVPESQHTVFIRGFNGDVSTDRIKAFFEEKIGHCSFDFVKQSPDKSRLFVAVRFDTREAARECLNSFNGSEVLGYPVEMNWFKDIRRYVSYQQSQGNFPSNNRAPRGRLPMAGGRGGYVPRGGRGTYYPRGGYDNNNYRSSRPSRGYAPSSGGYGNNRSSGGNSRTVSLRRSRSRSRSRSGDRSDRSAGSYRSGHSRSPRRSPQSRSPSRSRSRGGSVASDGVRSSPPPPEPDLKRSHSKSPIDEPKKKKHKRHRKNKVTSRGKRSGSRSSDDDHPSSDTVSASVATTTAANNATTTATTMMPKRFKRSASPVHSDAKSISRPASVTSPTIRPPSPVMNLNVVVKSDSNTAKVQRHVVLENGGSNTASLAKMVTSAAILATPTGTFMPTQLGVPPPSAPPPTPVVAPASTVAAATPVLRQDMDKANMIVSNAASIGIFNEMNIQNNVNHVLASIKLDERRLPTRKSEGGGFLRLSNFTKQISAESEREKKISQLSPEMVELLDVKRKDLELAYKQDCETFGMVVKILISKDQSLEERLLMSLRDALKDIGSKFVEQLDEYIDELLTLNN